MNHTIVTGIVRGLQAGVLSVAVSVMAGCSLADSASRSSDLRGGAPSATSAQELVDCLLPGQIRQLDESVTYLTERRLFRTTRADCTGRGGMIKLMDGSKESLDQPAR